jgi:hypothetical protein
MSPTTTPASVHDSSFRILQLKCSEALIQPAELGGIAGTATGFVSWIIPRRGLFLLQPQLGSSPSSEPADVSPKACHAHNLLYFGAAISLRRCQVISPTTTPASVQTVPHRMLHPPGFPSPASRLPNRRMSAATGICLLITGSPTIIFARPCTFPAPSFETADVWPRWRSYRYPACWCSHRLSHRCQVMVPIMTCFCP